MNNIGSLILVCFALLISKSDAKYLIIFLSGQFIAEDGHDAVYTNQIYYNKQLDLSYNSTEGTFTGYTEEARKIAVGLNNDKHILNEQKNNLKNVKQVVPDLLKALEAGAQEPQVRVFSTKTGSSHQPGILVCSAYSFYPKPITLTWLRNEEEVTSGVTSTEEMSNGNWFYQKHSYLEYTPTAADHISCMVEHASLSAPKLYPWDNFPESRRNKLTVGTSGLLLGLAFLIVGVIYYKKHPRGHVLVPN